MYKKDYRPKKDKEVKMGKNEKRCSCGGVMKPKGASDVNGSVSWKCKKCGKRLWIRRRATPPIPLVYIPKQIERWR